MLFNVLHSEAWDTPTNVQGGYTCDYMCYSLKPGIHLPMKVVTYALRCATL